MTTLTLREMASHEVDSVSGGTFDPPSEFFGFPETFPGSGQYILLDGTIFSPLL